MKRVIFCFVGLLLLVSSIAGCAPQEPAGPTTLNFVSFIQSTSSEFKDMKQLFVDKVNEQGEGKLTINVRGGPEVIAPLDLALAVSDGTFDMAFLPTTFYEGLVPSAGSLMYSESTIDVLRAGEGWDYLQQVHEQAGLYLLGWAEYTEKPYFFMILRKDVQNFEDLAGLKIGANPTFFGVIEAVGAEPFTVALPEYFSAMERGVADGITTSLHQWVGVGGQEVTKCVIDHPFYKTPVVFIVNLEVWNNLSQDSKDLLTQCAMGMEKDYPALSDQAWVEERQIMSDAGVKFVTFPPAVAESFLEAARENGWAREAMEHPDIDIAHVRELLTQ
jgi:TRAP-type C4-dicarboxylate transport system substrate-binding protein